MPIAPDHHDALPIAPSSFRPDTFDDEADAFTAALEPFGDQMDALADNAYANAYEAVDAAADAIAARDAAQGYRDDAADQVGLAADQVTLAAGQVTLATAQAVIATNKALAASDTLTLIENIAAGLSFTSHSTTSVAISAGAKTFTVDAGESFAEGMPLYIVAAGDPTRYMIGLCTGYAGTTLQVLVSQISAATGTVANWNISLGGIPGASGAGVAIGGATGQMLRKKSGADYDTEWVDDPNAAQTANIVAAFIEIAKLKGTLANMAAGVADEFLDQSGVDDLTSTGETYITGLYRNRAANETVQSLPFSTGASTPTGYVSSASSEDYQAAWYAFDGSVGSNAWRTAASDTAWVQRRLPSAISLWQYKITATGTGTRAPRGFKLQGSNNGTVWTDLDVQTGLTWTNGEVKTFTLSVISAAFSYHRLQLTQAGADSFLEVSEITLLQAGALSALSLVSNAFTAATAPVSATLTVVAKLNGGTINTDLIGSISRNNGTNYTAVTLTVDRTLADGSIVYTSNVASLAAQPSGTAMRWKLVGTATNQIDVLAVVLQWG